MARFWCSWVEGSDDHRPLSYPPMDQVLGWWCSGYDADDKSILCALVDADNEKHLAAIIKQDWPIKGKREWRFVKSVADDFTLGDRFPLSDWMKERIEAKHG